MISASVANPAKQADEITSSAKTASASIMRNTSQGSQKLLAGKVVLPGLEIVLSGLSYRTHHQGSYKKHGVSGNNGHNDR